MAAQTIKTFLVAMNRQQMTLIHTALKQMESIQNDDPTLAPDELEELEALVSMSDLENPDIQIRPFESTTTIEEGQVLRNDVLNGWAL
jgi:hypothetical protein